MLTCVTLAYVILRFVIYHLPFQQRTPTRINGFECEKNVSIQTGVSKVHTVELIF